MRIENRLRYWRRQVISQDGHIMTLRDLGEMSGVDYRHLSDIEQGRRLPTNEELKAICQALKIQPEDIYDQAALNLAGAAR